MLEFLGMHDEDLVFTKKPKGYFLSGGLDGRQASHLMLELMRPLPEGPLEFDFKDVGKSNSAGIVQWIRLLRSFEQSYFYSNCPTWMITQFNSVNQFFLKDRSFITSFYAPFYCEAHDESRSFLLTLNRDIPVLADYKGFAIKPILEGSLEFAADFEPQKYFHFIAKNNAQFSEFLSRSDLD